MSSAYQQPNIVLFMTDQHRADCLGIAGHPVVQTPHLDELAVIRFSNAYSACPVCMPARRTLLTGTRPMTHRLLGNHKASLDLPTLPSLLAKSGYQTHLCGKLHLFPERKLYGFSSADWADGPYPGGLGDYGRFIQRECPDIMDAYLAHGAMMNSWISRPWHLDDRLHFTNWVTDRALEFLERRDPTVPFFLNVSYFDPHQPVTPPKFYYDRYMNMELPEPVIGDWVQKQEPVRGAPLRHAQAAVDPQLLKQYRAGYYGSINHIDDQIGRILFRFFDASARREWGLSENTIFVFLSDHGEMLGDHQHFKKCKPFEASAKIPLFFHFPSNMDLNAPQVRHEVVELMDIMPTLLDSAGITVPDTVEGKSLLPLLRGEQPGWRNYLHGECAQHDAGDPDKGMQYITDGKRKYIWFAGSGRELFFNLELDPSEAHDLSQSSSYQAEIEHYRGRLIAEIQHRPEGFVKNGVLSPLHDSSPYYLET